MQSMPETVRSMKGLEVTAARAARGASENVCIPERWHRKDREQQQKHNPRTPLLRLNAGQAKHHCDTARNQHQEQPPNRDAHSRDWIDDSRHGRPPQCLCRVNCSSNER